MKLTATENAVAAVQRAAELCGNAALSRANPLERHLRDVLCARIHCRKGTPSAPPPAGPPSAPEPALDPEIAP